MTLTFEIGAWFFRATHCLDMPNTSAKLYGNPFMQYKVMARTKKTGHENMHISTENESVTLTFEIGTWFFRATRRLDMANTCAKLF